MKFALSASLDNALQAAGTVALRNVLELLDGTLVSSCEGGRTVLYALSAYLEEIVTTEESEQGWSVDKLCHGYRVKEGYAGRTGYITAKEDGSFTLRYLATDERRSVSVPYFGSITLAAEWFARICELEARQRDKEYDALCREV